MSTLLHISASPRGAASESLQIADTFVETYRDSHEDARILHWDLWDGSVPAFGPAAAGAKMTVFGGGVPVDDEGAAWQAALATFRRFDEADRLLFSVPMWNAGIPYVLKQLIDVISQPGTVFGVDPETGYIPLLAGRGKRAAVIYTSAVWGPQLGPEFGRDFQSTYFNDWLTWIGVSDISEVRYHPTLVGDLPQARLSAHAAAREAAKIF